MSEQAYQLIDSGYFRRLERVGPYTLSRPAPAAVWKPRLSDAEWNKVDAHFERFSNGKGQWTVLNRSMKKEWPIKIGPMTFHIRLTGFGHLGIFPEQQDNWKRLTELVQSKKRAGSEFRVLNLFAYTGGSSLAAAAGGAQVAHVDASKTSVSWARHNAEVSGLADASIRWLTEDVNRFVEREARRNSFYQGVILDPPSFGRGPKNEVWKIEDDLIGLLEKIKTILAPDYSFVMLSAHSPGYGPASLENLLADVCRGQDGTYASEEMIVSDVEGRPLPSGSTSMFVRK